MAKPPATETAQFLQNRDMWIRAVVESPDLSHATVRVGIHLAMRITAGQKHAWPATKTIAVRTGVGVRSVIRAIGQLERERFLIIQRRRNQGNLYWLRFIWEE